MITLRTKITIIVSLVTGVLMVGGASFEAHHLIEQGQIQEQDHQAVQIANILSSVADGVWDFDQKRTEAVIKGLFDARSTRRVQLIDPAGKVYVGLSRSNAEGTAEGDAQARMSEAEFSTPQMSWNELRLKTLKVEQVDQVRWRVLAPLWHNSARDRQNFIGHLLVEYSTEDSIARSQNLMFRLLVGGFFIALLIVLLLSIALQHFVLKPVNALMMATNSIADGNFDQDLVINTHDEMSILAKTFNSMRLTLKEFTYNLQDLVRQRTAELEDEKRKIQNILIHINEGILTFDSEFRIEPEISDHLIQILRQKREAIVGQDVLEKVFKPSNLSANSLDEMKAALLSIVGEDDLGFEANRGMLPQEIQVQEQVLDLDWVPISDAGTKLIQHMMLTMRDITEKRQMEKQMQETRAAHALFLRMVSDIVQAGVGPTLKVLLDADQKISGLLVRLDKGEAVSHQESFPILHTIKGNMRYLRFTTLIEEIHLAEEMVLVQRRGETLNIPALQSRLHNFHREATAYLETLRRVWGEQSYLQNSFVFTIVDNLLVETRSMLQKAGISIQRLDVNDGFNQWSQQGLMLLSDILVHALANSLDHGYLRPKAKGHDVGPFVFILNIQREGQSVHLRISDGGRGIDGAVLQNLYRQSSLPFDSSDPLRILFENSTSTAAEVTTRSGRGVGLFAIRELVQKCGGQVKAQSGAEGGFELNIRLPVSVLSHDSLQVNAA